MDYFSVEHARDGLPSSPPQRCGDIVRHRTLTFLFVCFSAFLILYGLLVRSPSSSQGLTENISESSASGQLRRMETSGTEERQTALGAAVATYLRGFVLAWNESRGFLLLKCDRKPEKGTHFQLPGGHLDPARDLETAAATLKAAAANAQKQGTSVGVSTREGTATAGSAESVSTEDLARVTAARELWEETGVDVRNEMHRLVSLSALGVGPLKNNRYYFFLNLTDSLIKRAVKDASAGAANSIDSTGQSRGTAAVAAHTEVRQHPEATAPDKPPSLTKQVETKGESGAWLDASLPQRALMRAEGEAAPGGASEGRPQARGHPPVQLPIGTAEHSGFRFEADPLTAAKLVEKHSGGYNSAALLQFHQAVINTAPEVLMARGIPVTFK